MSTESQFRLGATLSAYLMENTLEMNDASECHQCFLFKARYEGLKFKQVKSRRWQGRSFKKIGTKFIIKFASEYNDVNGKKLTENGDE